MQVQMLLLAAFRHGLYFVLPASALHGCTGRRIVIHLKCMVSPYKSAMSMCSLGSAGSQCLRAV